LALLTNCHQPSSFVLQAFQNMKNDNVEKQYRQRLNDNMSMDGGGEEDDQVMKKHPSCLSSIYFIACFDLSCVTSSFSFFRPCKEEERGQDSPGEGGPGKKRNSR